MYLKYLPLFIWSSLIFFLSSRPSTTLSNAQDVNTLLFKTAHVAVYAVLYLFAVIAFSQQRRSQFKTIQMAVLYSVIFAISDEVHQLFVPTRTGKVSDIFVDIIGIICAYFFVRIIYMHKTVRNKLP